MKLITAPGLGSRCNFFIGNAMVKPSDALKDFSIYFLFQKQESAWGKRNPRDKPTKKALETYNAIIKQVGSYIL